MKHLIREIEPECAELGFYFDGDTFTSRAGDFCYTLFIVVNEGYGRLSGLNIDEYKEVKQRAGRILDGFNYVDNGGRNYDGEKATYKECMEDENIRFNPTICARLRKWAENGTYPAPADTARGIMPILFIVKTSTRNKKLMKPVISGWVALKSLVLWIITTTGPNTMTLHMDTLSRIAKPGQMKITSGLYANMPELNRKIRRWN